MVNAVFSEDFKKIFSKIRDPVIKKRIINQVLKLKENPELGKPMRFDRKDTRELYIHPFRLSYAYIKEESKIIFLDLYHKDGQ